MTSQHDKTKLRRSWQFSLRALLMMTLAVGCFFGGWKVRDWELQRAARTEARMTLKGRVIYIEEDADLPNLSQEFHGVLIDDL